MLGIQLFFRAFKMLFHDIWVTVRLTLFPLAIGGVLIGGLLTLVFGVGGLEFEQGTFTPKDATAGIFLPSVISFAILMFVICWSAVGWHRYVLLQERPDAFLPKLNGALLGAYFWAIVRFFLVSLVILFPVVMLAMWLLIVVGAGETTFILTISAVLIVASALMFRIALIIPAAAIGKPSTIRESWQATKGYFWAFVIVAFASNLLNGLAQRIEGDGFVSWALFFILYWLSFAVSISILTTLYGHCIEKRELA
jgi:hypothetical protein